MAESISAEDLAKARDILKSYQMLSAGANPKQISSKAIGKFAKDCWKDLVTFIDSNAFASCKEKGTGYMLNDDKKVSEFIAKCAKHKADSKKTPKSGSWTKDLIDAMKPAQTSGTTAQSKSGGVDRMTDTSKYTGSHKERFDESGKGKGIDGRKEVVSGDGYVGAYKGKDTYDKKH